MSISTVTQTQLEQRKPQTLLEALSYTPGVRVGTYGFDPRYDAFTIRGIDVTHNAVFREGLRQIGSPNGLFRLEPYGVEGHHRAARAGLLDLRRQHQRRHRRPDLEAADRAALPRGRGADRLLRPQADAISICPGPSTPTRRCSTG